MKFFNNLKSDMKSLKNESDTFAFTVDVLKHTSSELKYWMQLFKTGVTKEIGTSDIDSVFEKTELLTLEAVKQLNETSFKYQAKYWRGLLNSWTIFFVSYLLYMLFNWTFNPSYLTIVFLIPCSFVIFKLLYGFFNWKRSKREIIKFRRLYSEWKDVKKALN